MAKKKIIDPEIREIIEEAIVDAYGDEEQEGGFLVLLEENLPFPFKALTVGEEVEAIGVDLDNDERGIMAICKRGGKKYRVSVTSLEWSGKAPKEAKFIEAYRAWIRGNW